MADSRNRAIAAATGKYLQFADSDDWLRSDATERMAEAAEQSGCELVVAGFYLCWSGAFMRTRAVYVRKSDPGALCRRADACAGQLLLRCAVE